MQLRTMEGAPPTIVQPISVLDLYHLSLYMRDSEGGGEGEQTRVSTQRKRKCNLLTSSMTTTLEQGRSWYILSAC